MRSNMVFAFTLTCLLSFVGVTFWVEVTVDHHLLFGVELICNLVLNLHFFVVISVLIFQSVLGIDLDCVFIFFGLH